MEDINKVYRIRTAVGEDAPNVIHVPLNQSYNMFEILSLKLDQTNAYKTYESDYGVIVGRVTANGGFGVPNAKVSVFINVSDDETLKNRFLYNYSSTFDTDDNGVRYNVLPDFVDDACHQDVGTFPNKRLVLDNDDIIEVFDKYWKYTTTTNHAGDYMLFGIPTGSQQLHVDVDLSDCGILSQRPRDLIGKGYDINLFESPNKFKSSTNLNSLAQIISQDKGVYVYPYWGDVSDGDDKFSITRCDINLEYKFESYAVFIGSIVTDKGSNAIGKNCTSTEQNGKMSDLIAGEGSIEMIRKTIDGKVEEFPIMGNRLIDGDGVWCYQIPMNLDYVTTDEFGNLVPTDNIDKGIATRTRVRFRISLDENPNDATARKRAKYLVPNNPRMSDGEFNEDYEFGSSTREESYCDMFWNKVYTVKNYIPKLQKNNSETNRKHTGIKLINHYGDNNPMPYNSLTIKLGFTYRIICVITKIIINLIEFVNELLSVVSAILCLIVKILELPGELVYKIFKKTWVLKPAGKLFRSLWRGAISPFKKMIYKIMPNCIGLSSEFCDDGINKVTYYPGCGYFLFRLFNLGSIGLDCIWEETQKNHQKNQTKICENDNIPPEDCKLRLTTPSNKTAMLYNCIENQLAQQNDATSFNFYNDWVNGVLYAPLWYRKIKPKKSFFFGLFKRKAKDDWCSSTRDYPGMRLIQPCTTNRSVIDRYKNFDGETVDYNSVTNYNCDGKCHEKFTEIVGMKGVIVSKQTMLGQTVYYYKSAEKHSSFNDVKLLFATDIVLLGSLNECDLNGVPQFFKTLESTTYNLPTDILFTDYDFILEVKEDGTTGRKEIEVTDVVKTSEMAGCDWGNDNEFGKNDGGLFYSIGCSKIKLDTKSCINLSRICEYGVSLDETKDILDLKTINNDMPDDEQIDVDNRYSQRLVTDGFISWDEIYNFDERSMFATMNGNQLKTKYNENNGLYEYDFRYLYTENFDGSLKEIMKRKTKNYKKEVNYKDNFNLETPSRDYYIFRMGNNPFYYDNNNSFPRYENSFYFYFGLKAGKTAIEKFNSQYFAECINNNNIQTQIGIKSQENSWCVEVSEESKDAGYSINNDGYLALDFSNIPTPYSLLINSVNNSNYSIIINNITEEKIQFVNDNADLLSDYVQLKGDGREQTLIYEYDSNGSVIPMMNNGSYQGVITDSNGEITEFVFNINGSYLTYDLNIQNFIQPNNVLFERFNNDYYNIAKHHENVDTSDVTNIQRSDIGGVATIYNLNYKDTAMSNYRIVIRPSDNSDTGTYTGVQIVYNNGTITYEGQSDTVIYARNHHYAFGLPKGKCEYVITIIQMCSNEVDSNNVVSKNFTVNEPMPYKMFINGIDYEVIKYFNHHTGWNPNNNTTLTQLKVNKDESQLDIMTNPWFHIENIYYNTNLIGGDNNYTNNDIVSFSVEKEDGESASTYKVYALTTDNERHEIDVSVLVDEFTKNKVNQSGINVYYNWANDYIVSDYEENIGVEDIDNFIEEVNNVFNNRKELVLLMMDTFYISCENQDKSFYISSQTDSLPYNATIAYHPEVAVENEDYNTLEDENLTCEDVNSINDIRIPTISYKSSILYGDGSDSNAPCIAQVDGIDKKSYYVGIMNNSHASIPIQTNGKPFDYTQTTDGYTIKHSSTKLNDLFNFPLIDKSLTLDYIVWSSFVNLPKYQQGNVGLVTMNGLLASVVCNGNVINNEFSQQTLNDLKLLLSDNFTDKTQTYIEKRIINGYDYEELGKWVLKTLKTTVAKFITQEMLNTINEIFGTQLTMENVLDYISSLYIKNGWIVINNDDDTTTNVVSVDRVISYIFNFNNYRIYDDDSFGNYQYAFLLPYETYLILEDDNGCGYNETINGISTIKLADTAVNDCKNNKTVFAIENEEDTYYYVFRTSLDGTGNNVVKYPLNLCTSNGVVWQVNEKIYGDYNNNNPQNLLSFQMTEDKFKSLTDKSFHSETEIYTNNDYETEINETLGYGTTGNFVHMKKYVFTYLETIIDYPFFVIAVTENHYRTLSPVYDYTKVSANINFGKVYVKNSETLEIITNYTFAIRVKSGHFVIDNYDYKLSGTCNLNTSTINVKESKMNGSEKFLYTDIQDTEYNLLKGKSLGDLKQITDVIVKDASGLKHICNMAASGNGEKEWYTYLWYANMPNDDEGGINYDNSLNSEVELLYETNATIQIMQCESKSGARFLGWTENQPNKYGPFVDFSGNILKATQCRIYYANWEENN